ncbi:hypothetical protein R1sor_010995 [Riccia sorocarpa]|uniref:Uncharacterized protein n=1 Tax=Riccia sorocarpa TaxID=122646 RepID=A0ABD3I5Q0_9MARC
MASRVRRGQRIGSKWAEFLRSQRRPVTRAQPQRPRVPKDLSVEIPESKDFYDTPSLKVGLGLVAVAIIAKLTMMYDESKEEERVERKAREMVELQGSEPKLVSRELWDYLQQLPPRTPFESRIVRDNARIRTGDPISLEDAKDWAVDVITDALARKDDSLRR